MPPLKFSDFPLEIIQITSKSITKERQCLCSLSWLCSNIDLDKH